MNRSILFWLILATGAGLLGTGTAGPRRPDRASQPPSLASGLPTPTPTYDPLAEPALPENPTQIDLGKHAYYYNCMPCHGDLGQGLTEEWRQVWEDDHRNCWAKGCHGGSERDEGFPIPTVVPAIILAGDALGGYVQPEDLFVYLRTTHPPQEPGRLSEDDYRALVAYLWSANGKDAGEAASAPGSSAGFAGSRLAVAGGLLVIASLALLGGIYLFVRRKAGRAP